MMTEASAQIVTETATGEPSQVLVDLPTQGQTETPPSDFVQVAEIEANKEITIAAIEAETEQARIEAQEGNETWQEGLELIRAQQAQLMATVETLSMALQSLTAQSIPPISEPAAEDLRTDLTEEPVVIVEPEIPEEPAPPSTETEPHEKSADESPVRARRAFMI